MHDFLSPNSDSNSDYQWLILCACEYTRLYPNHASCREFEASSWGFLFSQSSPYLFVLVFGLNIIPGIVETRALGAGRIWWPPIGRRPLWLYSWSGCACSWRPEWMAMASSRLVWGEEKRGGQQQEATREKRADANMRIQLTHTSPHPPIILLPPTPTWFVNCWPSFLFSPFFCVPWEAVVPIFFFFIVSFNRRI